MVPSSYWAVDSKVHLDLVSFHLAYYLSLGWVALGALPLAVVVEIFVVAAVAADEMSEGEVPLEIHDSDRLQKKKN